MHSLVIDARMLNFSGIGVYLRNIIPFLSLEFDLKLLGDEKELSIFAGLPHTSFLAAKAPIYSIREQLELRSKVPPCDVFWSPHYNIPLLPISARHRVVTIHDVYHLAYQHALTLPQKIYAKVFLNAAVSLSDKVITVSNFSKSEIVRLAKARETDVVAIYNGVDNQKFADAGSIQFSLNKSLAHVPSGAKYILFVGNVKPHKNLVTLLKAFSTLLEDNFAHNLVIVGKKEGFITGDNQIASLLEEHVRLKERVIFTGFIEDEDLSQIYRKAAVLVFPSVYEGFGLPPLEAMASGCPVVASAAASIPEICGDAAEYFDTLDHLSLAEKLKTVLYSETRRAQLIANGYEKAKEYQWEKSAQKHLAVFKRLIIE
ncbi:hypothetical protein OB13_04030 [Pontibacter sp. HJ8]